MKIKIKEAVSMGSKFYGFFLYNTCLFLVIFCSHPQIKHMMAFIEQEANEKAEEIDAKV